MSAQENDLDPDILWSHIPELPPSSSSISSPTRPGPPTTTNPTKIYDIYLLDIFKKQRSTTKILDQYISLQKKLVKTNQYTVNLNTDTEMCSCCQNIDENFCLKEIQNGIKNCKIVIIGVTREYFGVQGESNETTTDVHSF